MTSDGAGSATRSGKRRQIEAWLTERAWDRVTETRARELAAAFPDVSERTRRRALIESGVPLDALVCGVVQDSYDHLEQTLLALLQEYEHGDAARRRTVRECVIEAREHCELAAHSPHTHADMREQKREMSLWLRTWLENPPIFAEWVELRRRRIGRAGADPKTDAAL